MKTIQELIESIKGQTFSNEYSLEDYLSEKLPALVKEFCKKELKIADDR